MSLKHNQTSIEVEKEVAYLICYRESTRDRREALQFVLNWIYNILPNLEILLIEQDEAPKLSVKLTPNCKKIFLYNRGLFNRSWAFNVGIKHTKKKIIAFADADVIMNKADYLKCFSACFTFDAVTPKANFVTNIADIDPVQLKYRVVNKRRMYTFASMLLIMSRKAINEIGLWNENFEGWGYEDNAISYIIHHRLSSKIFNCSIFHIDHERTILDGKQQPKFRYNMFLMNELDNLSGKALERYCELEKNKEKGDTEKYLSNPKQTIEKVTKFILAITTINNLSTLKSLLNSWNKFKSPKNQWEIIISDEGASEKLQLELEQIAIADTPVLVLKNENRGIVHAYNTLFRHIKNSAFSLCFFVKPEVLFKKQGWDMLYWDIVQRTGMGNLVFREQQDVHYRKVGFFAGLEVDVESNYLFFTMTTAILEEIGYMDNQNFSFSKLALKDFFYRCSIQGFNNFKRPLDAFGSKEYIDLLEQNSPNSQQHKTILAEKALALNWFDRKVFLYSNRIFLPWNELDLTLEEYLEDMKAIYPELKELEDTLRIEKKFTTKL